MKRVLIILLFFFASVYCFAGHIAGGELFYKYIGPGAAPNSSKYSITLRLFRECNPPLAANGVAVATLPTSLEIAVFNNTNPSTPYGNRIAVNLTGGISELDLKPTNPCIVNAVEICYQVANYTFTQDLPNTAAGYVVMYQTCCRTNGIWNVQTFPLSTGVSGEGATYMCEIPGSNLLSAGHNSSAVFSLKDTTLVCKQSPFTVDFSATDPDGDSLSYSFCAAYDRGGTESAADPNYSSPPFNNITYTPGFSGGQPLGSQAVIDPVTGLISGISPDVSGYYTVNVCITEWRNGIPISFHRKDFTLRVTDCVLTGAILKPTYLTCNGTSLSFQNESTSSNIISYLWDFGVPSITTDTSSSATPTYDYLQSGKDSGTYTVKLKVASATGCRDSTTANVKVYPGFAPGFTVAGSCYLNKYIFTDTTKSKYGTVESWSWNFGDNTTLADTSHAKDSAWKYPAAVNTNVTFIVSNSYGCVDTVSRPFIVPDKPSLNLPFKDTLICSNDTLALKANITTGTILWTVANGPNQSRILNTGSNSPLVFPQDTTRYYVSVNDNGCINTDTVTVNVLQFISVKAGTDTTICKTDTLRLQPISYALAYLWTSSSGESVQAIKNPLVKPLVNTKYNVIANLGHCQAKDSVFVKIVPYPTITAGADQSICYGSRIQLTGTTNGSSFSWSPTASLINQNTLTPVAGPTQTTTYILSAFDTLGCPKPSKDTIIVTVIPRIVANAGKDTSVVPGQSLQLDAGGGDNYVWTPPTGLSNPYIANPVAIFDPGIDSVTYTVRVSIGACFSDDQVKVRVFKTGPEIFVPSAFSPNGDGRNDIVKPVLLGISKLLYFSIYNRWGQLVFTTTEENKGWDGYFSGIAQPSGTYVFQTSGTDYTGKPILRKGTIVLIR